MNEKRIRELAAISRLYNETKDERIAAVEQRGKQGYSGVEIAEEFSLDRATVCRWLVKAGIGRQRRNLRTHDDVYTQLIQEIGSGKLKSGEKLPTRSEFMEKYHCARTTGTGVKKALARLGFIELTQNNDYRVT